MVLCVEESQCAEGGRRTREVGGGGTGSHARLVQPLLDSEMFQLWSNRSAHGGQDLRAPDMERPACGRQSAAGESLATGGEAAAAAEGELEP